MHDRILKRPAAAEKVFLVQVQEEMVSEVWSDDTLKLGPCLPLHGAASQVLFLGPRVKMGIYEGRPNRICPHTTTGRADYFGPFVNRRSLLLPLIADIALLSGFSP